jgi:hypothetical protein
VLRQLRVQRRGLDELRSRAGDGEQAHRREGTGAAVERAPRFAVLPAY